MDPAPIAVPLPILTPGRITVFAPIETLSSMTTDQRQLFFRVNDN